MEIKSWFRKMSIRTKLLLVMLGIVLLTEIAGFTGLTYALRTRMEPSLINEQKNHLRQIAENLDAVTTQLSESAVEVYMDLESRIAGNGHLLDQKEMFSVLFSGYYRIVTKPIRSYKYIHSMLLVTKNGHSYFESKKYQKAVDSAGLFERIAGHGDALPLIRWAVVPERDYFLSAEDRELISMIVPIQRNNNIIGFLAVNLEEKQFAAFLADTQNENSLILQISGAKLLTADGRDPDPEIIESLHHADRAGTEELSEGYLFTEKIKSTGWNLSILYRKDIMRQNLFSSLSTVIGILTAAIIAVGLFGIFVVYEITDPIKRLTKEIESSEKSGEFRKLPFSPRTDDEVGQLIETYNRLIEKIQETMQELEAEKESSRLTYLQALQMQINPHFLYNSLGNLRYLVEMNDPRATEMIVALGDYYKLAIIGADDETSVETEFEMAESYLKIMKMRYGSKFDYEICSEPDLVNNSIVKISVQPLVENAIYHGLKQKRGKGKLLIRSYREEDRMVIEVYDNGNGIPEEKAAEINRLLMANEKIRSSEHVGLLNVNQRIRIHFGEEYGIMIDSSEGNYTSAKILLPVRRYSEKEKRYD